MLTDALIENKALSIADIESFGFRYTRTDEENISMFFTPGLSLYDTLIVWHDFKTHNLILRNSLPGKKAVNYFEGQVKTTNQLTEVFQKPAIGGKDVLEHLDGATKVQD